MRRADFEKLIAEAFEEIPQKFRDRLKNVAFVVEDEPPEGEELLGLYTGTPATERGSEYGAGPTMPDVITIYRRPIEREARDNPAHLRRVVRETVWHEVAHYLGMDEHEVAAWEERKWKDN